MIEFSKNKWKYSTFGFLAVLAIGYSFPDALAVSDSQLKKRFDAIWAAINGLVAKTDDLQAQIDNIELISGDDGLHCWDLNGDGVKDSVEDINDDGKWDALDCQGSSSGFSPNTAPVVDAGTDQSVVGIATAPGGTSPFPFPIPVPSYYSLGCEFDLNGNVEDDAFTGYLAHEWVGASGGLFFLQIFSEFADANDPTTEIAILIVSQEPITTDIPLTVTLTADDGILQASDEVQLTCRVPA